MKYYPFGSLIPNRHGSSTAYRYGFQGQEKDDELKGEGNSLNYTFRMHDPRVGRFFARDPLEKYYAEQTPYQFSSNAPMHARELEGMETAFDFRFERRQRRYLSGEINHEQYMSEVKAEASGAIAGVIIVSAIYTGGRTLPLLRTLFSGAVLHFTRNQLLYIGGANTATGLAVGFLDESGTIDSPGPIDDFARTTKLIVGNFIKSKFTPKFTIIASKLDYALGEGSTVSKNLASATLREIDNMAKSMLRGEYFKRNGIDNEEKLIGLASQAFENGVTTVEKHVTKYGEEFTKQTTLKDGTAVNVNFIIDKPGELPRVSSFSIPVTNKKDVLKPKVHELREKARKLGNANLSE
ncbi:hypothetical protein B0A78_13055 [Flavobacterium columnare NBRC 100251 = ATCC 23463]|uniref:RHS repeat domain-containing protein n=1 Tax=Flavobacterium columnare TaxID=996 RepID=UPI000BEA1310|nr:hypothetical protein B0A78_13055 [Flavobacterium columnare NBRC 100251 = ATCC 23463]